MLRFLTKTILWFALMGVPLFAVDYGGEKSHLVDIKYQVCVVPPQVDEAKAKGINVVDVDDAKTLFDNKATFYDAREARHYKNVHIQGALPIFFDQSKAQYLALDLPDAKNSPIVFYCYGETCASSYEAALAVRNKGYTNVHWFINGMKDWLAKGYPVVR